jgi:hypothetical protein
MPGVGERQGAHGGVEPSRPAVAREAAEGATGCEARGGGSMAQGREGHAGCGDTGPAWGCAEGALDAVSAQGRSGGRHLPWSPPSGGPEPGGVAGGVPGGAQQEQGRLGQRDVPVCGALPSVDLALETLAIPV